MVNCNMDGPPRDRVMSLILEKDRLEREIVVETLVLQANNVGMNDSLVDAEGFPRNDIDVYKVRQARHQIICLQNDHKSIMQQIERGLEEVHAEFVERDAAGGPSNATSYAAANGASHAASNGVNHAASNGASHAASNGVNHAASNGVSHAASNGHGSHGHTNGSNGHHEHSFAIVNFIQENSPAFRAGLNENDELIEFGSVNHSNFRDISQVHNVVMNSIGQPINLRVRRNNAILDITVVPRRWSQPGLMGCHIRRIS